MWRWKQVDESSADDGSDTDQSVIYESESDESDDNLMSPRSDANFEESDKESDGADEQPDSGNTGDDSESEDDDLPLNNLVQKNNKAKKARAS